MSEIRFAVSDPQEFSDRVRVANLKEATPQEKLEGFYPSEKTFIPALPLRCPTARQLDRITTTPDDPEAARLIKFPAEMGRAAIAAYDSQDSEWMDWDMNGVPMPFALTQSFAHEISTTVDQLSQERVGFHVDLWPRRMNYVGVNLGRGSRYFCFAPIDGMAELVASQHDRLDQITKYQRRHEIKDLVSDALAADPNLPCYFVRLNGPTHDSSGQEYFEGYANVPVYRTLHDGSTYGIPRSSRVMLAQGLEVPSDYFSTVC